MQTGGRGSLRLVRHIEQRLWFTLQLRERYRTALRTSTALNLRTKARPYYRPHLGFGLHRVVDAFPPGGRILGFRHRRFWRIDAVEVIAPALLDLLIDRSRVGSR